MKTLTDLRKQAAFEQNKVVAVAGAADEHVLAAVKKAVDENMCSFRLFGAKADIALAADAIGLDLGKEAITVTDAIDPVMVAVKNVHDQKSDILMKGNVQTKHVLKAVLDKAYGLRGSGILSHVALFEIPNQDRLLF